MTFEIIVSRNYGKCRRFKENAMTLETYMDLDEVPNREVRYMKIRLYVFQSHIDNFTVHLVHSQTLAFLRRRVGFRRTILLWSELDTHQLKMYR